MIEVEAQAAVTPSERGGGKELSRQERNRLITHLGRVFSRRYDMAVIPSRSKGVWATSLDPKVNAELEKYLNGQRETLDDLSPESFKPRQILYDEESAQTMSMDEISTILHHEAGHAKYTDFRAMVEGQKYAKDEGHLPTSFWITFEGIEDPRVNGLEGAESPAIDRQIRRNQAKDLQERITEASLKDKPKMLQFAYDSFHRWLNDGEGIPELVDTDVGKLGEAARPLLEQYFQNTDPEQRKILQRQIWDIAKGLEKQDIEDEEKRQMAEQKGMSNKKPQQGQSQGEGDGQSGDGSSSGEGGEGMAPPALPGGKGERGTRQQQEGVGQKSGSGKGSEKSDKARDRSVEGNSGSQPTDRMGFLKRLKKSLFGDKDDDGDKSNKGDEQQDSGESNDKEKIDLSKLSPEELQEIEDAINQLSSEDRAQLERKARETIDEAQKEALQNELSKTLKLEKNKETGEYEVKPQTADEGDQRRAQENYERIKDEVEREEQEQLSREEQQIQASREAQRRADAERQEKIEMQKAGFDENEREKFLLYQRLEDSMYTYVRNFRQAIEKVVPRRGEPVYEGGFFRGSKFDRRDLIRKAPLGDEQFHMRQTERPTGEPRLFVGLLVDNSPSMAGAKMEQARKTIIFFAKVCQDMGIPFTVAAFGDDAEVIKQFRQDFNNPAERIKPKIIDATDAGGRGTNLHAGLEVTIESMNQERRKLKDSHGVVFAITDGGANMGLTGEALRNYIEENRGRLTFKAFGLSGGSSERMEIQGYLNHYFGEGNCAYPQGFEDLPDEAFRVLRINLMQFQRYLS